MSTERVRRTAVASVLLVAAVAAVCSYCHMQSLAERSGEEWRSWLTPLSVDGMLVASTLAIVDRRRAGLSAGWVPWMGLSLGILASLAANVAAARPDPIARIIAAWPPIAFAVAVETLVIVLRGTAPNCSQTPEVIGQDNSPDVQEPAPSPVKAAVVSRPKPSRVTERPDNLLSKTRKLVQENPGMGRRKLMKDLDLSEYDARKLLEQVKSEAPRNGVKVLEDAR